MSNSFEGHIISYNSEEGYGFVKFDGQELTIFFHKDEFKSSVQRHITVGRRIRFYVLKSKEPKPNKLFKAIDCVLLDRTTGLLNIEDILKLTRQFEG